MTFELRPTIDLMWDLYQKPRGFGRFKEYLSLLQGDTKGDMILPISGFNPMAKDHILQKLSELKQLNSEKVMKEALAELNAALAKHANQDTFQMALNLSDDTMGGWTHRYTSDYDSKFKLHALVVRRFCVPVFWTSEPYTPALIRERTLQYAYRTVYWLAHPKPITLKDHIGQERFVAAHIGPLTDKDSTENFAAMDAFYKQYQDTDNYHIIFNFLYGDSASQSLAFPCYGISGSMTGYAYAYTNPAHRANKGL